jgi:Tfp pilus assembly protein PilE
MKNVRSRGYTLLDLLLCGTIIACLSAIAVPSYQRTLWKDRRTLARSALVDLAARQEDHHLVHRTFANQVGSLVGATDPESAGPRYLASGGGWRDRPEKNSVYRVEVLGDTSARAVACGAANPGAEGLPVALSATAMGPQSGDGACHQLVLCFAGRPGAKTAFDDAGRSNATLRDACWGQRPG